MFINDITPQSIYNEADSSMEASNGLNPVSSQVHLDPFSSSFNLRSLTSLFTCLFLIPSYLPSLEDLAALVHCI
jgi:hypothetical protein